MFKKAPQGYYFFEELEISHGFSSRAFGDCRKKENRKVFLNEVGFSEENLILPQQVHFNKIRVVGARERGKIIEGVDGLITKDWSVVLGVRSADCLPILFFDKEAKIIGIAHSGWRGVLTKLPQKMIDQMIRMGGIPNNILVAIGPHICSKCYKVEKKRTLRFIGEFGKIEGMVTKDYFLDLFIPTKLQLIHSGIPQQNIFYSSVCTSCNSHEFFSYRKDDDQSYGEMLTVIGFRV